MYNPQGEAVDLPPDIQTSAKWVTWIMMFQFQIVVGDIIIVLPPPKFHAAVWGSLTMSTDRFIECTTSMIGIFICVSFPRLLTWLCLVSLFSLLCPLFTFVAQLRFHSQRGWSGDRISESHGILLEITECLVYKRLHSHNIASSCTSCTSFTKDAYPKIPQFSNTLFLTGKCRFVVAIDIAAFYLTFHWVPCTVAISFRLWRVYRQTAKAGIQVGDSIILVRITCRLTSKEAD